jgi:hypothetical protein
LFNPIQELAMSNVNFDSASFANDVFSLDNSNGGQLKVDSNQWGNTASYEFANGTEMKSWGDPHFEMTDSAGKTTQAFDYHTDASLVHSNEQGEANATFHVDTAPTDSSDPNSPTVMQSADFYCNPSKDGQHMTKYSISDSNGAAGGGLSVSASRVDTPTAQTLGAGPVVYQSGSDPITNQQGVAVDQTMVDQYEAKHYYG